MWPHFTKLSFAHMKHKHIYHFSDILIRFPIMARMNESNSFVRNYSHTRLTTIMCHHPIVPSWQVSYMNVLAWQRQRQGWLQQSCQIAQKKQESLKTSNGVTPIDTWGDAYSYLMWNIWNRRHIRLEQKSRTTSKSTKRKQGKVAGKVSRLYRAVCPLPVCQVIYDFLNSQQLNFIQKK